MGLSSARLDHRRLTLVGVGLAGLLYIGVLVPELLAHARGAVTGGEQDLHRLRLFAFGALAGIVGLVAVLFRAGHERAAEWLPPCMALALPFVFEPSMFSRATVPQGFWIPFIFALALSPWRLVALTLAISVGGSVLRYPGAFSAPLPSFVALIVLTMLVTGRLVQESLRREAAAARVQVDAARLARGETEASFEAMFESLGDALIYTGADRRILRVNPAFVAMFGYTPREVIGRTSEFLYVDREGWVRVGELLRHDAPGLVYEQVYRHQDGHEIWCESRAQAVFGPDGSVLGYFGLHRDIGARRRAEAAMQRSRAQLVGFIRQAPTAIAMFDRAMNYLAASTRWAEMAGRAESDLIGRNHQAVHPDQPAHWLLAHQRALAGEPQRMAEDHWQHPDGRELWLRWTATPWTDEHGAIGGLIIATEDVSAQVAARRLLERHRSDLEAEVAARTADLAAANETLAQRTAAITDLYDHAPCGYFSLDAELKIRAVNRTALLMLGYAADEMLGRPIASFVTDESRERHRARLRASIAEREVHDLDYEVHCRDGRQLPVRVSVSRVHDAHGRIVSSRATMLDDSERVARDRQIAEMQHELARRAEQAEAANRAKSAFLANMSHEIRTPMNAVIGLTHLMLRESPEPRQRDRLGKIDDAARHLLQLINDVLDLSKIEAGKMALDAQVFRLDEVMSRAFTLIADRARAKDLELVLDTDHVPERLVGDPTRLSQALINLLSNAVKFTDRGWIRVRGLRLRDEGRRVLVRFEVQDTGCGIPPERQGQLFHAFEQADTSTSRRHGGTGLGLALTRRIAELMGGEAGVDSRPGDGSCFWFSGWFERADEAAPTGDPTPPPALGGLRVLLVDDLAEAREALGERLCSLGLMVESCDNGIDAVRLAAAAAAAGRPHGLVLVDWRMLPIDGLETLRRLQFELGPAMPPAVLVTAHDDASVWRQAHDACCDAVLIKPVTSSQLHDTLLRALRRPAARPLCAPSGSEPAVREDAEQRLRRAHAGRRVLLVEDNPINREVASHLLTAAGLVVDCAEDGLRALERVVERPYDLVLMDVQMPGMDGLTATRRIRERLGPALPIVAMTANAFHDERQACLEAGMNDHVAKPVNPALLYDTLSRWLPGGEHAATAAPAADTPALLRAADPAASLRTRLAHVPGYDLDQALRLTGGDAALLERVLRRYVASYRDGAMPLLSAAAAGDVARCRQLGHALRGASASVGAQELAALLQSLEQGWRLVDPLDDLDAADAAADPARLLRQAETADASLRALVGRLGAALDLA